MLDAGTGVRSAEAGARVTEVSLETEDAPRHE